MEDSLRPTDIITSILQMKRKQTIYRETLSTLPMVVELLNDQASLSVDTGLKYYSLSPIMLFIILKPSKH